MVDREKVVAILTTWFAGAADSDIQAAATALVGLGDEWEEVSSKEEELGYHYSQHCSDICYLADQVVHGARFRLFRERRLKIW